MEMVSSPAAGKNWELTPDAFARLLTHLDADPEAAGEKYILLHRKLARFFEWNNARQPAEELASRVFDIVARKLDAGEAIRNLNAYCNEVARLILKESYRTPARGELEEWERKTPATPFREEELWEREARLAFLESCLGGLPPESRELIVEFYRGEGRDRIDRRQRLADRFGIARNALGNRVQRLLDKLERCLTRQMAQPARGR
ncbi:MAG: hypothetical protein SF339_14420 [Blastocatellia bacterium]|nr:hypothetical protein [Blastocatellia bacterium]